MTHGSLHWDMGVAPFGMNNVCDIWTTPAGIQSQIESDRRGGGCQGSAARRFVNNKQGPSLHHFLHD